jgi:predicted phosphodiesterase
MPKAADSSKRGQRVNRRDFIKTLAILSLGACPFARPLLGKTPSAAPDIERENSWAILSDSHVGDPRMEYPSFMRIIEDESIERVIHVGDAIDKPGNTDEWRRFLEITGPGKDFHLVPGNHDISGEESLRTYLALFPEPYSSFSQGDTLFLLLCTELPGEESRIGGKQLAWVTAELQRTFRYKFLFLHEAPFPVVPFHGLDRHPSVRDRLHELFVENGVSLVVAGHDHVYDRKEKDGVTYVIDGRTGGQPVPGGSGNGHSLCYTIATRVKDGYSFAVRGKEGEAVDRFSINRRATGRAGPSISDRKSDLP